MSVHEDLGAYLDRRLDRGRRAEFERHLDDCGSCREQVDHWHGFAAALGEDAANGRPAPPEPAEIESLVERARARRSPGRERVVALRWAGAIAALVAIGLAVVLLARPGVNVAPAPVLGERPTLEVALHRTDRIDVVTVADGVIEAPAEGRAVARLGQDRVEVGGGGRLELLEDGARTRLKLTRGRVECQVASRGATGEFVVLAGAARVRVVGTRFAVSLGEADEVEVTVEEGTVEVLHGQALIGRLGAGEELALDSTGKTISGEDDEPTTGEAVAEATALQPGPRRPDAGRAEGAASRGSMSTDGPATWREWIVEGRVDEAAAAIAVHLGRRPADTAAWSLLADCRRKQGRAREAIEAYQRVIEQAPAGEANRARFKAGSLAQDRLGDHALAVRLFGAYLEASARKPLAAEALVRRARALVTLGRGGEARGLLERAIAEHGGTRAATRARRMLDELEGSR